jgi:hypothetical protein
MERNEKRKLKDGICSYKKQLRCKNASTKVYMAYFGIQKRRYYLKELLKKRKRAVFRKRVSAKTAVFSGFKSVCQ